MPGETVSGDFHLVKFVPHGTLVAVADGLGHGEPAARAARLALDTVRKHAHEPLVRILEHCSRRLRETRGAAMSLAFLNSFDNTMEWLGVGSVEGMLVRSTDSGKTLTEFLLLSQGIVGVGNTPQRTATVKVAPGDSLLFVTDGIRRGFESGLVLSKKPGETARDILARSALETDDALVLVARYQGRPQ